MSARKKPNRRSNQRKIHLEAPQSTSPEVSEHPRTSGRVWLLGVLATVVAAVGGAWLTPLPGKLYDAVFPEPQIQLSVQPLGDACTSYASNVPVNQISAPPSTSEVSSDAQYADWADSNRLAVLYWSKILITVKGSGEDPLTITGIRFAVSKRNPPIKGVSLSNECGDETIARFAVVDLDRNPPVITESTSTQLSWGDERWRTNPLRFPYEVTNKETETLLLIAKTDNCECFWKASLSWTIGATSGTSVIDYKGKPFHTSAAANIEATYHYDESARSWTSTYG